jgi:hypothetical protein
MKLAQRFSSVGSEAGETLIEVLMSTALMGLIMVGIIGGFATMLLGSKLHRDQADGNRGLVTAMETLKSPDVARKCAANDVSHPYYTLTPLPSGVTIQTIEYEKIVPDINGNPSVSWSTNLADCDLTSSSTLQRITLLYTSTDSKVTPSLSFIKGQY